MSRTASKAVALEFPQHGVGTDRQRSRGIAHPQGHDPLLESDSQSSLASLAWWHPGQGGLSTHTLTVISSKNATSLRFCQAKSSSRPARPCTCTLRINTTGSLTERHRSKKAYEKGQSWPFSGPLIPGNALDAARAKP